MQVSLYRLILENLGEICHLSTDRIRYRNVEETQAHSDKTTTPDSERAIGQQ